MKKTKKEQSAPTIELFPLANFAENDSNPRVLPEDTAEMVNSLLIFPKMLSVRPLSYTKDEDKLVVLGGNYRLRGLNEIAGYTLDIIKGRLSGMIGWAKKSSQAQAALLAFWEKWLEEPLAYGICLDGMTEEEKEEFIIKDNLSYGKWDEAALLQWEQSELNEWGLHSVDFTPIEELNENIESPALDKPDHITVSLPSFYKDQREEIVKLLEDALLENYSECNVK